MRKIFSSGLMLILLVYPYGTFAKNKNRTSLTTCSQRNINPDVFYKKVVVYLNPGGIIAGLFSGIEEDFLVVRTGGQNKKIPFNSLAKISIEREKQEGWNPIHGIILGTYLGNLIFNRAKNQPLIYREEFECARGIFFQNIIFASVGGAIGYLSDLVVGRDEKNFDFTRDDRKRLKEWENFKRYIYRVHSPKRFHISIQGGQVFPNVSQGYIDTLENSDFYVRRYQTNYINGGMVKPASTFNLLRKVQFCVSVKPKVDVGLAFISAGEPSINGERWKTRSQVNQSLDTKGIYAVGIYKPFLEKMPKGLSWHLGVGAGAAKVDFTLEHLTNEGYPTYYQIVKTHNISNIRFSAVFFTELNLQIYKILSLGFIADYVFVPSETVPGMSEINLPEQKLSLGNGSIGFSLSLHF